MAWHHGQVQVTSHDEKPILPSALMHLNRSQVRPMKGGESSMPRDAYSLITDETNLMSKFSSVAPCAGNESEVTPEQCENCELLNECPYFD